MDRPEDELPRRGKQIAGMGMRHRLRSEDDLELDQLKSQIRSRKAVSAALLAAYYSGQEDVERPLAGLWHSSGRRGSSEKAQP